MSAPSSLPIPSGRGRGVARRRGFRQKPIRRPGAKAPEAICEPDLAPLTDSPDPARAAWIEKLLADPSGAKRERLEAKRSYWQARLEALEARFRAARQAVIDALKSTEGADDRPLPPAPAAVIHELRIRRTVAWADVQAAKAELRRLEAELADA